MRESYIMKKQNTLPKYAQVIDEVCGTLGVVGDDLLAHLKREIPSKILFRRAQDVVLLSGHTGTGKEVIASTCHHVAKKGLERNGELVEVNCANLSGGVFESQRRSGRWGAGSNFVGVQHSVACGRAPCASHSRCCCETVREVTRTDFI